MGNHISYWVILVSVVKGQVSHWNLSCLISEPKGHCLWLLTNYVVIWVKSKLSCVRMCSPALSTAIYLVPDTCWAFCLALSIQVWTKVNAASAFRELTLLEGCEQKYSYRIDVFLKGKLLHMHLWSIWLVCSLRKSFPEGGWPEFWSNGELTGQKRGAYCAERTAHSAVGGGMAALEDV